MAESRKRGNFPYYTPGQGTFLSQYFFRELCFTEELEFASAPPGDRAASSVPCARASITVASSVKVKAAALTLDATWGVR